MFVFFVQKRIVRCTKHLPKKKAHYQDIDSRHFKRFTRFQKHSNINCMSTCLTLPYRSHVWLCISTVWLLQRAGVYGAACWCHSLGGIPSLRSPPGRCAWSSWPQPVSGCGGRHLPGPWVWRIYYSQIKESLQKWTSHQYQKQIIISTSMQQCLFLLNISVKDISRFGHFSQTFHF